MGFGDGVRDRARHGMGTVTRSSPEAEEDAVAALFEIEAAILGTVPMTAAGLVAKALWATRPGLPMALAAEASARVTADVVAMAERGGVAS